MKKVKDTSADSGAHLGAESISPIALLALASMACNTRARTSINRLRVFLFATSHAGFYPMELFLAFGLQSDGAKNGVYSTLKKMETAGWLNSKMEGKAKIYYCSGKGRIEAAKVGATLITQTNELLEILKNDRYGRGSDIRLLSLE